MSTTIKLLSMQPKLRLMLMALSVILFSFVTSFSSGQTTATLTSDLRDYSPGSVATLTGEGFAPNEVVTVQVLHVGSDPDGTDPEHHQPWNVTADEYGNFTTTWNVPIDGDALGASFKAIADGQTSKLHAEAFFTDAVTIWANTITGSNPGTINPYTAGQTFNSKITVSGIGRGSGVNGNNGNDRYNADSWNTGAALDANDYFYFRLAPNSGYHVKFNNFQYSGQASPQGPTSFAFRSDANGDNYTTNIGSPNATGGGGGSPISLSGSQFQNITSQIEFRFYGWAAGNASGTFSINDFTFSGAVLGTSVTSLSGFSTCLNTASTAQSFTVNGDGLTPNSTITIAPSANYEVSVTSGTSGFQGSNSVTLITDALGSISGTVWVRLKSNGTAGTYNNETINISGGGFSASDNINVTISGSVNAPSAPVAPATQQFCSIDNPKVSNLSATGTGGTIKWYNASMQLLSSTDALATGTYYVTQTTTCESLPTEVSVTVNTTTTYYRDADGDGYGNPSVTTQACTTPLGYVGNNTDCNDDPDNGGAAIHPGATEACNGIDDNCDGSVDEGFTDTDSDGTKDCVDTDDDNDDVLDVNDCAPLDNTKWRTATVYTDGDGDGYTVGSSFSVCYGANLPAGVTETSSGSDCDDGNNAIHSPVTYYRDFDNDGYGDAANTTSACQLTPPSGYVSNNTDCNDNDNKEHPGQTWYIDADNDGYPASSVTQCSRPANGKVASELTSTDTDCNDADNTKHAQFQFYVDSDHDGYGTGSLVSVCAVNATTPPTGYSTNNTDCDDGNNAINPGAAEVCDGIDNDCDGQIDEGFTDTDNDGQKDCVDTDDDNDGHADNADCAPLDATKWQSATLYVDNDGDTYTVGNGSVICYGANVPTGYTLTKSSVDDCNDADATIAPYPVAPTGNATQAFFGVHTVADLVATPTQVGGTIKWYTTANSITPLASTTILIMGHHYFATQTIGSCESSARLEVVAVVTQQEITSINNSVFCAGDQLIINFRTTGTYLGTNVFTGELSNGGGQFGGNSPDLVTISVTPTGTETVDGVTYNTYQMVTQIPIITTGGGTLDHYRVRVNASAADNGTVNGTELDGTPFGYDADGFTINPVPDIQTVNGGGAYCSGGTGVVIGLDDSQTGVNYLLYYYTSPTDSTLKATVAGTGAAINFPLQTVAGTYKVKGVFTDGTGCGTMMSGSATVTINAVPQSGTLTKDPNQAGVCDGTLVKATFNNDASGGAGTITDILQYRFDGGSWNTYTSGTTLNTHLHSSVDIQTYRTATGNGCTSSTPNVVSWTVGPLVAAAGTITGDASVCYGVNNKTYSISAVNGATSYAWTVPTGATYTQSVDGLSITVDFGTATSGSISVTPSSICFTGTPSSLTINIYPTAPVLTAPVNTCNAVFTLPNVDAKTGYTVQYNIDNTGWSASPTVPTSTGCHTIKARYVLTSTGAAAPSGCAESNQVSVVIFPAAPSAPVVSNTCNATLTIPALTAVSGFTAQYSFDGGTSWGTSNTSSSATPGCYTMKTRYVLTSTCGGTSAGATAPVACDESASGYAVIFPAKPVLSAPLNTCASAFTLPTVTAVSGFTVQYSFNDGAYVALADVVVPTTPGCYSIKARYVLTSACGSNAANATAPASCLESDGVNVVIFPSAPVLSTPDNTCNTAFTLPSVTGVTGFTVEYKIDAGSWTASPVVPTSTGCHTVKARYVLTSACGSIAANTAAPLACAESNEVSVVVFPAAPVLQTPVNTCNGAFTLPSVSPVSGFTIQFKIDGGSWTASPVVPTTPGCHTVKARYVLTSVCGTNAAYTVAPLSCQESNEVSVVIFPAKPVLSTPANTCNVAFSLPSVTTVSGFTVQYSINGGTYAIAGDITLPTTPRCYSIRARYVLTSACGNTNANATAPATCLESDAVYVVIFPAAPVLTNPDNTCNAAFTLPAVAAKTGFTVQYNIDGLGWSASPTVPTTPGCHTIKARYVLTLACGGNAANATAPATCLESNEVSVVIFPAAPTITAPASVCNSMFTLPSVTAVGGFTVQYQIDNGNWETSPGTTATGCHTVKARYVLTSICGDNAANATAPIACAESNTVTVVIFPDAPPAPTVNSGAGAIVVTAPASVSGFNIEYSFDDGSHWGANTPPTADNCEGYKIKTRYVTASACGSIAAGADISCSTSPYTLRVVDNTLPSITCKADVTKATDAGQCYATVTLQAPTVSDACGVAVNGLTNDHPSNQYPFGTTVVTWTVTDVNGNTNTCQQNVIVNKVTTTTTVTVTPVTPYPTQDAQCPKQQYSQKVSFTATVSPVCVDAGSIVNAGSIVTFKIGTQTMGTAPVDATGMATLSNVTLTETVAGQLAAGTRTVTAVYSGYGNYLTSTGTTCLQIVKEDLCTNYNGFMQVSATSTGKNSANAKFALSVGVADLDGTGDVTKLKVRFTVGTTTYPDVSVQPVNGSTTEGNASMLIDFSFNGSYTTLDVKYEIISDYYEMNGTGTCDDDGDVVINLYVPQNEFITGGGYIRTSRSVGKLPAESGRKANFGFNVKYTKSGTNLQGNINYIFRRMEDDGIIHVYQVKGNAMSTLTVNATTTPRTAIFNGKCNVADVTVNPNPLVPLKDYLTSLGGTGNSTMQVLVSDGGEPGTSVDEYGITVWNSKGELFHSSNWISTQTVKLLLSGGNIQVNGATSIPYSITTQTRNDKNATDVLQNEVHEFKLAAYPNPTNNQFKVQLQSSDKSQKIQVRVTDVSGRVIQVFSNAYAGQIMEIGSTYRPGIYIIEMIQGNQHKQLKLVKIPD